MGIMSFDYRIGQFHTAFINYFKGRSIYYKFMKLIMTAVVKQENIHSFMYH